MTQLIADEMRHRLEALAPTWLEVIDESHLHAGHAGARPEGQTHYRVKMSAQAFADLSRVERHRLVMDAYLQGLEKAKEAGHDVSTIHSVASFFVSRVDTEIDKRLDAIGTDAALALRGKAGLANARLAYAAYEEIFGAARFAAIEGANVQRPLWASTGVKNPDYDDTMYVSELVAPDTVNTMPEKTLQTTFDHGVIAGDTVTGTYAASHQVFDDLAAAGVDLEDVTQLLEDEGVEKFVDSWRELLATVKNQLES